MSQLIAIDRFTRSKQVLEGTFAPADLPRLAVYLGGPGGEIRYRLSGSVKTDAAGSQKRRIKCIISGWFLLVDPVSLDTVRHEVDIESVLVLVGDESELPPLELEAPDEDYIVAGAELDVLERVEEEILLEVPGGYLWQAEGTAPNAPAREQRPLEAGKPNPFAKLAALKKK